jgi:hypothetical protein
MFFNILQMISTLNNEIVPKLFAKIRIIYHLTIDHLLFFHFCFRFGFRFCFFYYLCTIKEITDVFHPHIPRPSASRQLGLDSHLVGTDHLPDLGWEWLIDCGVAAPVAAHYRTNHPYRVPTERRESDGQQRQTVEKAGDSDG